MSKRVLVPVAEGTEEIEAVACIDILRRAGIEVVVAAVAEHTQVEMGHGIRIVADALMRDVADDEFDMVYISGGLPGATNIAQDVHVTAVLKKHAEAGKYIAAICASPAVVLAHHGLLGSGDDAKHATAYPAFVERLPNTEKAEDRVVVDGRIITSRAPGTACEAALKIVELLASADKAEELRTAMLIR